MRVEDPFKKVNPLMGGVQIYNDVQGTLHAGTLGAIFEMNGKRFGLTSAHVVNQPVNISQGNIWQPAVNNNESKQLIGRASDAETVLNDTLDYCFFRIPENVAVDENQVINKILGSSIRLIKPVPEMNLINTGTISSGLKGRISQGQSQGDIEWNIDFLDDDSTQGTDSGSLWILDDDSDEIEAVLLHRGVTNGKGVGIDLQKVMESFQNTINPM